MGSGIIDIRISNPTGISPTTYNHGIRIARTRTRTIVDPTALGSLNGRRVWTTIRTKVRQINKTTINNSSNWWSQTSSRHRTHQSKVSSYGISTLVNRPQSIRLRVVNPPIQYCCCHQLLHPMFWTSMVSIVWASQNSLCQLSILMTSFCTTLIGNCPLIPITEHLFTTTWMTTDLALVFMQHM